MKNISLKIVGMFFEPVKVLFIKLCQLLFPDIIINASDMCTVAYLLTCKACEINAVGSYTAQEKIRL